MPTNSVKPGLILDLPLLLDGVDGTQSTRVHAGLRAAILGGRVAAGVRLPSSRSLADQLGVRRNAVVVAYEQLLGEGLAEARVGAGTYVAARVPHGPALAGPVPLLPPVAGRGAFALGRTLPNPVLLRRLGQLVRRSLAEGDPALFGYGDPRGSEQLRCAIAGHLGATRGITCDPGCILITTGTQAGLRLCIEMLMAPSDRAWMEDPGYPPARRLLEARGARLVPVAVDGQGLDVAAGRREAEDARLAYVTPSHQFPTGVSMTMARRLALLDWAHEAGAWVLEDDYDSEFRFSGAPLTALAGIDGRGRVIYLGTFSKTVFPGLRCGYVVFPPALIERAVAARAMTDRFPPSVLEAPLARLITDGSFAEHVRHMRKRYRAARDILAERLVQVSGGMLGVRVPDQGLHLVATLPEGLPPDAANWIRSAAGVEARLLSDNRIVPGGDEGFVLGYSGYSVPELKEAAKRLGHAAQSYHPEVHR
ncbi:PLP-dependent aminotransferase family protein [Roseomonas haemaphysalidis]|uniref:PLP-dependent aminotransferase family protein n=1 Tax=Roseomonas haemaphysalidis TaxID=2768162 RepID=A0ABS3KJW7_9PROT|nr:PLP-dependent aminotransferase family protein [Roseomonas haemaphysalidis]MBO1077749.1 PLP-dependent aminotransferase family protein [Roseomonas haemaphysalidis]